MLQTIVGIFPGNCAVFRLDRLFHRWYSEKKVFLEASTMENTFPKRVYQLVQRIPAGRAATYGQLAALAGSPRASRIVGAALAHAPAGLPCHRVLYRDGTLCCNQAFGGKEVQRQLLEAEGVPFLPDGRADLKHCLWDPTESMGNLCDFHSLCGPGFSLILKEKEGSV